MTDLKLPELPAKWRAEADACSRNPYAAGAKDALRQCASELEAARAAVELNAAQGEAVAFISDESLDMLRKEGTGIVSATKTNYLRNPLYLDPPSADFRAVCEFVEHVRTLCFDFVNDGDRPQLHHMRELAWRANKVSDLPSVRAAIGAKE